jgi:hypothetical protein
MVRVGVPAVVRFVFRKGMPADEAPVTRVAPVPQDPPVYPPGSVSLRLAPDGRLVRHSSPRPFRTTSKTRSSAATSFSASPPTRALPSDRSPSSPWRPGGFEGPGVTTGLAPIVGTRFFLAALADAPRNGVMMGTFYLLVLLLVRTLLRSRRLAAAAFAVPLFGLFLSHFSLVSGHRLRCCRSCWRHSMPQAGR